MALLRVGFQDLPTLYCLNGFSVSAKTLCLTALLYTALSTLNFVAMLLEVFGDRAVEISAFLSEEGVKTDFNFQYSQFVYLLLIFSQFLFQLPIKRFTVWIGCCDSLFGFVPELLCQSNTRTDILALPFLGEAKE